MSVKYSLSEKGNPADPNATKKWYARAKSSGEISFRSLSKEIAGSSTTVSDTDVLAVLNDLSKMLAKHLADGKIVRFGDFGSFSISLSSDGAESPEKFNSNLIKNTKIVFRPGIDLKETLAIIKYEKTK